MELNRIDIENKINNLNKLINNIPDDSKETNDNNKIINDLIIKKFEKIRNFEYILNNRNINFHQQSLINSNIMRLKNEVRILKSKISKETDKTEDRKINENITLDIEKNNQNNELKKLIINATTIIYNFIRNNNLNYDCDANTFKNVIRIMATENYNLMCLKGNFQNIKKTLDLFITLKKMMIVLAIIIFLLKKKI